MRQLASQVLRFLIVAVALGASSMNGYASVMAAFDTHTHGPHGAHSHPSHDHGQDHQTVQAGHGAHDQDQDNTCGPLGCEEPASNDQPCTHLHMHCCTTFAVQAGECGLRLAAYVPAAVPVAVSLIPHGQLSSPLFRPPRAAA